MLAGIGVAVGSPAGDHARIAATGGLDKSKDDLNDLHNADENNRTAVAHLRRALTEPNVVKVVQTR